MKGDIVHFQPCYGVNEFKMYKAIENHLKFCRDTGEIDKLKRRQYLRGHAHRLSGTYQHHTIGTFRNFNLYRNNYKKTSDLGMGSKKYSEIANSFGLEFGKQFSHYLSLDRLY